MLMRIDTDRATCRATPPGLPWAGRSFCAVVGAPAAGHAGGRALPVVVGGDSMKVRQLPQGLCCGISKQTPVQFRRPALVPVGHGRNPRAWCNSTLSPSTRRRFDSAGGHLGSVAKLVNAREAGNGKVQNHSKNWPAVATAEGRSGSRSLVYGKSGETVPKTIARSIRAGATAGGKTRYRVLVSTW